MSAAAPLPPPYPAGSGHGAYSTTLPSRSGAAGGGERVYKHIDDLKLQALTGFQITESIGQLIEKANVALRQAGNLLDFKRPDMSYVEYLRASELVVEIIPHHKDWTHYQYDQHNGGIQRYALLQKKINAMSTDFADIKSGILLNNQRSGVQPTRSKRETEEAINSPETPPRVNGHNTIGHSGVTKIKPSPSPKPDNLHGRALSVASAGLTSAHNTQTSETLNERFAKLRMLDSGSSPSRGSNASSVNHSPVSMPKMDDYNNRSSLDLSKTTSLPSRPMGPRGMPDGNAGPPLPGKLPLDTSVAAFMPKAPSPTYSPARNMQTPGHITAPRHSARSLAQSSTRKTSTGQTSSASSIAPNGIYSSEQADYFPSMTPHSSSAAPPVQMPRRKSVYVPKETRINNERLYDYLERFNILLIDFRSREDFDQGHIYARNVVCIDPLSVYQGMSAEQLLERMVLGPEDEQDLFMARDRFDLVIYYDANTQSETFLTRPVGEQQNRLKCLHEALYDFNLEKPLQRPPILLVGGIEAWADLVGQQALMTSATIARMKQGRAIQRRPAPSISTSSQLRVAKRRLRDYNPLDADEEQRWRERARAESVVLPAPGSLAEETEGTFEHPEAARDDHGSAIQEFLERFPEAGSLDKYAFAPLQPSRSAPLPPEVPAKVPMYPSAPALSQIPQVPTRPQPAAPRMSYTGVSDRSSSQNAPLTRSTSMAPYVPPKYLATNLRLPKTGLHNFSNTCYMNATVQALSGTTPLSIFFLNDSFKSMLVRENWKGTKGVVPDLYSNLIRSMWKGDVNFIKPSSFRSFCGRLKSEWGSNEQQDAKEFFDFLIDCLHEDLNGRWSHPPLRALTEQEEAHRERMPKLVVAKMEWLRYTNREHSFITNLFGGQHMSRLRCAHCGHTSTTYETFMSISVEIPRTPPRSGRMPTLDECLRSYCQEELLTGDDQVNCLRCKQPRDHYKQITLTRAPQFLVIHFKRFDYLRNAKKIHTPIDFPLENLGLDEWMLPSPSQEEAALIARDYGSDALKTDPTMTPPYTYDCYSVIRHIGQTLGSGHYISFVKDRARGVWRCFNDDRSHDFVPGRGNYSGANDLRNDQAYILFYQRKQPYPQTTSATELTGIGKM